MLAGVYQLLIKNIPDIRVSVIAGPHSRLDFLPPETVSVLPRTQRELMRGIASTDILMIVGGTHLASFKSDFRHTKAILRQGMILAYARLLGKKVFMAGVGIGPFETRSGEMMAACVARLCNAITVRDERSLSWLASRKALHARASKCVDPAFALNIPSASKTGDALGISLMPYFANYHPGSGKDREIVSRMVELASAWWKQKPAAPVVLFPFLEQRSIYSDSEVITPLYEQLAPLGPVRIHDASQRLEERIRGIGACTHFISFRYHAMLFAFMAGVPQLAVAYHDKNRTLAGESGLPAKAVFSVDDLLAGKLSGPAEDFFSSPTQWASTVDPSFFQDQAENIITGQMYQTMRGKAQPK